MEKLFRLDGEELREFTAEEYEQYNLDQVAQNAQLPQAIDETPSAD